MWEREIYIARKATNESGRILRELFGKVSGISKKGEIDLVTEADFKSEHKILEIIGQEFPEDSILAEESGKSGVQSERRWIIDPLDGTTNFAHMFPFFAVSIALEAKGEIVIGMVYNPYFNEFFEAVKGKGAYLNGQTIKVSNTGKLQESLLATGFPYNIQEEPDRVINLLKSMVTQAQGVRRAGSAAIDLCYVAAGRLDGFWEQDLKPWDTAAGSLIVKEAGGVLGDYMGDVYSPFKKTIVAANPYIFQAIVEITMKHSAIL